MKRHVSASLVICALLAGCGADEEVAADAGDGGSAQSDSADGESHDSSGAVGDADTVVPDRDGAGTDAAGDDIALCTPSTFACAAACGFNFSSFAADRDGLATIGLQVGDAGPIEITSLAVVDSSPKASFSSSFVNYIERITGGSWLANATDTAFEVNGDPIEMPAGSTFEIDVRFRSIEDGTGCPSAEDCGAAVVQWQSCGVTGEPIRLPIRR